MVRNIKIERSMQNETEQCNIGANLGYKLNGEPGEVEQSMLNSWTKMVVHQNES